MPGIGQAETLIISMSVSVNDILAVNEIWPLEELDPLPISSSRLFITIFQYNLELPSGLERPPWHIDVDE